MATLAQVDLQKLWDQVVSSVSTPQYNAFLSRTKPLGLLAGDDGSNLLLSAPDLFTKDVLETRLRATLTEELSNQLGEKINIAVTVTSDGKGEAQESAQLLDESFSEVPVEAKGGTGRNSTSLNNNESAQLNPRYIFETFVIGASNRFAHAAAVAVAEAPAKAYNPLFIYGGVGLGKTHLLNAIGNKLLKKIDKVIYVSAERFMYQFVRSIKNNDVVKFKDIFRSAKVLIIDDIQFVSGKDVTQEEFFHTFNALIESGSQIVISCDRPPNELDRIQDRIKSRLSGGLVVDIQSPDFEQRVKILKQRCLKEFHASERNIAIDDEVINFIANELKLSVREMIGAFNRIAAYLNINNRKISVAEAKSILRDSLNKIETNITIEDIQKTVVSYYNISMHDFMSSRRSRSVARPRQIAMYLSKKMTTKSLPDIGRRFSGRDHTTVIHAIKKVEELMIQDKNFENEVKDLNQKLTKTV